MPIKKKDGSVFHVPRPNPIMKTQDLWDDSKFILHNFEYKEETVLYKNKYTPIEDIVPQEIEVPIKSTPIPPTKNKKDVLLVYCLPANNVVVEDHLYSEKRTAISYGPQFTFEAIIKVQTDLSIKLWSNVNVIIEKNSILYIPSQWRWWAVDDNEVVTDGFLLSCSPSKEQPTFVT